MITRRKASLLVRITVLGLILLAMAAACGQETESAATNAPATNPLDDTPEPTTVPIEPESTEPLASVESADQEAVEHFDLAVAHGDQGQWGLSIEELDQAIALNPQYAEAYFMRGSAYEWMAGDDVTVHEKAIADLTQAITLDPQIAGAYLVRGLAYQWTEGYEKSIEDFNRAIVLDSQLALAYHYRGRAYVSTERYEQAIVDLTQAIALDPQVPDSYYARGTAYMWTKEVEMAIEDFSQAIALNPQYAEAYMMRAIATGQYYGPEMGVSEQEQIIADFARAIELDPVNTEQVLDLISELYGPDAVATAIATMTPP